MTTKGRLLVILKSSTWTNNHQSSESNGFVVERFDILSFIKFAQHGLTIINLLSQMVSLLKGLIY